MNIRQAGNWARAISDIGDSVAGAITSYKTKKKTEDENNFYNSIVGNQNLTDIQKYDILSKNPETTSRFINRYNFENAINTEQEKTAQKKKKDAAAKDAEKFLNPAPVLQAENPLFSNKAKRNNMAPVDNNTYNPLYPGSNPAPSFKIVQGKLTSENFDEKWNNLTPDAREYVKQSVSDSSSVKKALFQEEPKQLDPYEGQYNFTEYVRGKDGTYYEKISRRNRYGDVIIDGKGNPMVSTKPINSTVSNPKANNSDAKIINPVMKKVLDDDLKQIFGLQNKIDLINSGKQIYETDTDQFGRTVQKDVTGKYKSRYNGLVDNILLKVDQNSPQATRKLISGGRYTGINSDEFARRLIEDAKSGKLSSSNDSEINLSETFQAIEWLKYMYMATYGKNLPIDLANFETGN